MRYPLNLTPHKSQKTTISAFGGCNHTLGAAENEFFQMENLSSHHYPLLSPSKGRRLHRQMPACGGIIAKDALCYVNEGSFYINDYPVSMDLTPGDKTLVSMGAWVIVLPDKKRVNTVTHTVENLEAHFQGAADFFPAALTGDALDTVVSATPPEDTAKTWIDTAAGAMKQYSASAEDWLAVATPYTRIEAPGIGANFELYDGITLSGVADPALAHLNAAHVVWGKGENHLLIAALCPGAFTQETPITASRSLPDMDFVIEYQNRLWGCKYGMVGGKAVNEIYASKLGDPKNFHCFMGIASDSLAFSCGSDGPFTAAAVLDGPLFFKENCLHRVYGDSYPFALATETLSGVAPGAGKSAAVVGDTLYYKANAGIMAYDGGRSVPVSRKLGTLPGNAAAAGAWGEKYYIDLGQSLYVLDTARGLWHRETGLNAKGFCCCADGFYAHTDQGITALDRGDEPVRFFAETGLIAATDPDSKYLSRITVRLRIAPGAQLRILLRYDEETAQVQVANITGKGLRSFTLPIRPRRCDYLRLTFAGQGDVQLLSVTKTMEKGGTA